MTLKRAHYWLEEKQRMMTQYRHLFSSEDVEANGIAILAIEKQMATEIIHDAPTIEAESVRHGYWVHSDYNEFWGEEYRCSICNGLAPLDVAKTKFCPHCGAKMEDNE